MTVEHRGSPLLENAGPDAVALPVGRAVADAVADDRAVPLGGDLLAVHRDPARRPRQLSGDRLHHDGTAHAGSVRLERLLDAFPVSILEREP